MTLSNSMLGFFYKNSQQLAIHYFPSSSKMFDGVINMTKYSRVE